MADLDVLAHHLAEIGRLVYASKLELDGLQYGAHDRNWEKEHELFYCRQPGSAPYATRLFLSDDGQPAGYAHIRLRTDGLELSETYLAPPSAMSQANGYFWTCLQPIRDYGQEEVACVPFITPDTLFSMCAQASVWICIRILHETSGGFVERVDLPSIQTMSKGHPFADHEGLEFKYIARVLRMCRSNAFYFDSQTLGDDQLEFCLYAYIESGLPVIIGVDVGDLPWWNGHPPGYHSIVAIGHTMNAGKVDGYLFHDESTLPYQRLTLAELTNAWHNHQNRALRQAVVAVPPSVVVPVHVALQLHQQLVTVLVDRAKVMKALLKTSSLRPTLMSGSSVIRMLVVQTPAFMNAYAQGLSAALTADSYWVIEMWSPQRRHRRGFFLMDSTGGDFYGVYSDLDNRMVTHAGGVIRTFDAP